MALQGVGHLDFHDSSHLSRKIRLRHEVWEDLPNGTGFEGKNPYRIGCPDDCGQPIFID